MEGIGESSTVSDITDVLDDAAANSPKDEDHHDEVDDQGLSHQEAMETLKQDLSKLIQNDPLLCDLPPEITLEEVNSQIALEYGQAMTVNVRKADGEVLPIVVVQGATVQQLKAAVQRHVMLNQSRKGGTKHISWEDGEEMLTEQSRDVDRAVNITTLSSLSYIWRTYWLYFDGQKLTDDNKKIKEYNIRNRDEVTFIKRLKQR